MVIIVSPTGAMRLPSSFRSSVRVSPAKLAMSGLSISVVNEPQAAGSSVVEKVLTVSTLLAAVFDLINSTTPRSISGDKNSTRQSITSMVKSKL